VRVKPQDGSANRLPLPAKSAYAAVRQECCHLST
jgi:hypothetical protein